MGDFNFGQFQEIYQYLIDKLKEGGALTPEEQKTYDMLIGFANQGLNLTGTADFNSLYTAFNALADESTKNEFEKLYGKDFTQGPNGQVSFSQPGSIIEAFQRRGLSVNDGPAMAALTQGLKDFTDTLARNKFASMTNSYAAMTPIRAQNIQAATNAGNIASTAIGRRVPAAGFATTGARAASASGAGEGVGPNGLNIDTTGAGAAGANKPGFMDKFGGALIGLLGTGALGVGGYLLKKAWEKPNDPNKTPEGDTIDRNAEERPPGWQGTPQDPNLPSHPDMGNLRGTDPYAIDMAQFSPQQVDWNPYGAQQNDPYADPYGSFPQQQQLNPQQYYGMGSQGYQQPAQQPYDYQDYYQQPQQQQPQYDYSGQDWTQSYDPSSYQAPSYQGDWGYNYDTSGSDYYPDPSTADYGGGWY